MTSLNLGRLGQITFSRPAPDSGADRGSDHDTATVDSAVDSTVDSGSAAARFPLSQRSTTILAASAAVVLLVVGIILTVGDNRRTAIEDEAGPLKSAIASTVVSMLSYDYASADRDLAKATGALTSDFRTEYSKLVTETIVPGAREKRVVTKTNVVGNSIVTQSADKATLLLFLNQITTTSDNTQPTTMGSRVVVTAVKADDKWLIDSLKPV